MLESQGLLFCRRDGAGQTALRAAASFNFLERIERRHGHPSEHYAFWREELPDFDFPWGAFGENLTTEGIIETDVHIGDRFGIGTAEFVVTQPRMPCFKLGIRFGRPDMVKRFLESGRSGFYFAVAKEGVVEAGDAITVISRHPAAVPVPEIVELYTAHGTDPERLRRVSNLDALPESWREFFRKKRSKE